MMISSRTPEGQPNHCPICDRSICIEPSSPFGDAPCPSCGQLLWFVKQSDGLFFHAGESAVEYRNAARQFIAGHLGVSVDLIPEDLQELDVQALGGDSLDMTELAMLLEEEFKLSSG